MLARKMNENKIDFVVLWVDPSDPSWQKSREKCAKKIKNADSVDNRLERYRDWGLFEYWFRGVEKFAPWVNKIHLVTCGHVPKWLSTNHPKLNIVNHADFMPREALPTFNSNAIELCIHKIPGLAEQFVLFNDDTFIINKVKPTDFFKNNLPVNTMALFSIMPSRDKHDFHNTVVNDITVINKHFNFNKIKKKNILKFLSLKQREWIIFSYPLLLYNQFVGFRDFHIPNSYLKSTYNEVWDSEPEILRNTVESRFRDNKNNVNHWLFNYWQFASGKFLQRDARFGVSLTIVDRRVPIAIAKQKYRMLCINDTYKVDDLKKTRKELVDKFQKILPNKSSFEV